MTLTFRSILLLAAVVTFCVLGVLAFPHAEKAAFDFALAGFAASFLVP